MCQYIILHPSHTEVDTIKEFVKVFGFTPRPHECYGTLDAEACLCQIDVQKELRDHGVPFNGQGAMSYRINDADADACRQRNS